MKVLPATEDGKLDALALNDSNQLELRVFANEAYHHAVLVARLDNLGKGRQRRRRAKPQIDAGTIQRMAFALAIWRIQAKFRMNMANNNRW